MWYALVETGLSARLCRENTKLSSTWQEIHLPWSHGHKVSSRIGIGNHWSRVSQARRYPRQETVSLEHWGNWHHLKLIFTFNNIFFLEKWQWKVWGNSKWYLASHWESSTPSCVRGRYRSKNRLLFPKIELKMVRYITAAPCFILWLPVQCLKDAGHLLRAALLTLIYIGDSIYWRQYMTQDLRHNKNVLNVINQGRTSRLCWSGFSRGPEPAVGTYVVRRDLGNW